MKSVFEILHLIGFVAFVPAALCMFTAPVLSFIAVAVALLFCVPNIISEQKEERRNAYGR